MAAILIEGFDLYDNTDGFKEAGWTWDNASAITIDTTGGRYGGGSLKYVSNLYSWGHGIGNITYGNVLYVSFAYKRTLANDCDRLMTFTSDLSGLIANWGHDYSGQVYVEPQTGSTLWSGTYDIPVNQWVRVECKITFGTTASNGAIEIRVNGVTVLNESSIDTNGTGSGCTYLEIGAAGFSTDPAYIDDLLVYDSTGSYMNGFLGDCLIETLSPDGDGGTVDWTASSGADYTCVDETPNAANDDTDYISSNTAGQESRFTFPNLGATPTTIHCISPRIKAKKEDAGIRTLRTLINSSSTESTGTTMGLNTTYTWLFGDVFMTDPNTTVAWTESGVNAVQAGVEIVA